MSSYNDILQKNNIENDINNEQNITNNEKNNIAKKNNKNIKLEDKDDSKNRDSEFNDKKEDNKIIDKLSSINEKKDDKYVGSTPMDLIRDLYIKANPIPETTKYDQDFIKNLSNYKINDKYEKAIDKAKEEKKKLNSIKQYKNWSLMLSIPLVRLLENTDEQGKISVSDYDDFLKGPLQDLKNKLNNELDKKNDKGETAISSEEQNFIKKAVEELNNIENNNSFSFNPTEMRVNLGKIYRSVCFNYQNASFIKLIIIAIRNFFTFSNFNKDVNEITSLSNQIINDVNLYYKTPLEERQILVNEINKKLARVKLLLNSSYYFMSDKTRKCLKTLEEGAITAMDTKVDSANAIVSFIRSFGLDAIKNVNINTINEKLNQCIKDKLKKTITQTYKNFDEHEAELMTGNILNCDEKSKNYYSCGKKVNVFYDGMAKKEYDDMIKKLENTSKIEDIKIKCNNNLIKVEDIKKQTEQVINSINIYTTQYEERVAELKKNYSLLGGAGASFSPADINSSIENIKNNLIKNITYSLNHLKYSYYEYIDDNKQRAKITSTSEREFKNEKEEINKIMKDCLYKDGKPNIGKESDVIEIKNMLSNMANVAELSFKSWERIQKIIDDLKLRLSGADISYLAYDKNKNNNLFDLVNNKNAIENKLLNTMLDKGFINSHSSRMKDI